MIAGTVVAADMKPTPEQIKLHRHILTTMPLTVRVTEKDTLGNYALPKPYSVPCIKGGFQNMFYWDTYFTNVGLLLDGDIWQAANNIEDIAAMIERFGYMPNATAESMINRTQPSLFSAMVRDYFDVTGNIELLAAVMPAMEKEYEFWMTKRIAPNGLNRYGHSATDDELIYFCNIIAHRVGVDAAKLTDAERLELGAHLLAEAESGWDFNPRFHGKCMDYNPVDLNAILYNYELNMAHFNRVLKHDGAKVWEKKAAERAKKMQKLMVDPKTKLFYDYDFVTKQRSDVYSAASLVPLWARLASKAEAKAAAKELPLLEADHGLMVCQEGKSAGKTFQWDAPNGWAPTTYFAICGLDNYGYKADAERLAKKYVDALTGIYTATGQLWEKYNAKKGNTEVGSEYAMPGEFMGWTAGAFQYAYEYLFGKDSKTDAPRVVNVLNFIRFTEPRRWEHPSLNWVSDTVLYECVESQIDLMKKYNLKNTFLIEYDALIQPNYQDLLKNHTTPETEIGGWWEITEPHCKAAGIEWRGRYPWDWFANVGFSTGYTPEEREKLVDVYMDKFKEVFGYYPKSVGSWFIDSHSLAYMHDKYGIEASAACRDQLGTDGYNLWGGYWQGGYYPSRKNFYLPAQTRDQQIDVPTFRLLGSDPIAQYDCGLGGKHQSVVTLEPVYGNCGGNPEWVDWFFESMIYDPAMNMSYFQAGQENMFTWPRMRAGLEYQFPLLARLAQRGDVSLETLSETGQNFKKAHALTPPSSISALEGFKRPDQATIWFNSKDYRLNLMWENGHMFVRDIHLFDQNQESLYLTKPCTTTYCHYWSLPVVDGNVWSNDSIRGAIRFYEAVPGQTPVEFSFGKPEITNDGSVLEAVIPVVDQPLEMVVTLTETTATFTMRTVHGARIAIPRWYAALEHAPEAELPFDKVESAKLSANYKGFGYKVQLANATFADRSTAPRNDKGALCALTITPDANSFTLNFAK